MPVWISLFLLLLTYLPHDIGAFGFVLVLIYLYLWLAQTNQPRQPCRLRPPPSPDPLKIKTHKLAVKECRWRIDCFILPSSVWLLWRVLQPVSATPHTQLLYVIVFGWIMFRWCIRRLNEVARKADWASNRLSRSEIPIKLNEGQILRQPPVHELEMHGDLLVQALIYGALRTVCSFVSLGVLVWRGACRLC
jgi:hypothetical protein